MLGFNYTVEGPSNQRFRLTTEAFEELRWFVTRSKQMLANAAVIFQRQEQGFNLVYGLDFEILYAYANPWSRKASQARLVQYLIDKDSTPFVLLPGTVEELKDFLDYVNRKQLESQLILENLREKKASEVTITAAKALCNNAGLSEDFANLGNGVATNELDLDKIAQAMLYAMDRYTLATKRINHILKSSRIIELESIFPFYKKGDVYWEDQQVESLASRLFRYRPDRNRNYPDAKNLAVISQHANQQSIQMSINPSGNRSMLCLLSNTPCLFSIDMSPQYSDHYMKTVVNTDETLIHEAAHSFALRNCPEAALAAAIQQTVGDSPSEWRNRTFLYLSSINQLREILSRIDNEARNYRFRGDFDTVRIAKSLEELSKLTDGQFAAEFLTIPWYSTMKQLFLEQDVEQMNKQLDDEPYEFQSTNDLNLPPIEITPEIIRKSSFRKIEIINDNKVESLLDSYNMKIEEYQIGQEDELLSTFIIKSEDLTEGMYVVRINKYQNEWYAEWPTTLSIDEALNLIGSIFTEDSEFNKKYLNKGELTLTTYDIKKDDEPIHEKLINLPIKKNSVIPNYAELAELLTKIRDGREIIPIDICCNTDRCYLRIEIAPVENQPGIIFSFRNLEDLPILFEIFTKTSPFSGSSICLKKMDEIIKNN